MGNVCIFVDAGYLFKQGAGAVLNAKLGRHDVMLDARRFVEELAAWVRQRYPADELLRTYWYDGARRGIRTPEQLDVAALPFVKLRLGRINASGQQKGVDTLIVRDLMVLSQERSIHRAVVLSGDEDLREGVEYVQDRGVRVAVVGIEALGERSQSVELVREADESLVLPQAILAAAITRRTLPTPPVPTPVAPVPPARPVQPAPPDAVPYAAHAEQFAREWVGKATAEEIAAILADRPRITRELDALMLQYTVRAAKVATIEDEPRRLMRRAFWTVIDGHLQSGSAAPANTP